MSKRKRLGYELIDKYISDTVGDSTHHSSVRSEIVRELLNGGLTQKQSEYIKLRYIMNLTGSEIARMYGVNRSTVSRTLSRARMRILKLLSTEKVRVGFESWLKNYSSSKIK